MKKLLLPLIFAGAFILTACEEKIDTNRFLESEKRLVQIENELAKSFSELMAKNHELEQLKAQLEQTEQKIPALQVEITPLFEKSEKIALDTPANKKPIRTSSQVSVFVSTASTQVEWLDTLLLKSILQAYATQGDDVADNVSKEDVSNKFANIYQELTNAAKEFEAIGMSESLETFFVGQRNHIATFTQTHNSYTGGAHGMYYTRYVNIDLQKQAIIRLEDFVPAANQSKLKTMLWQKHRANATAENGDYVGFSNANDFNVSANFYFSPDGVVFVYPVYELASFAEGEIGIHLYWHEINSLLHSDYQLKATDGFGLRKESEF